MLKSLFSAAAIVLTFALFYLRFFSFGALRNALVVAALEHYSPTTVVFPAAVGIACVALASFIALRRHVLNPA